MFHRFCLSLARFVLSFCLISSLVSFPSPSVQAITPKPVPVDLLGKSSAPYASDHLLVKFRSSPVVSSLALERASTGSDGLDLTLQQAGARRLKPLFSHSPSSDRSGLARTFRLDLQPGQSIENALALLSADPHVEYAEPDFIAQKIATPNDPQFPDQWGLAKIQAPGAWDLTYGDPTVVIAIVDSGIDLTHEDLIDNLWVNPGEIPANGIDDDNNGFIDDVDGWNFIASSNDLWDDNGHGTLVAGIAAASSNNSKGITGVCGLCRILPVKVMQPSGSANYSDIAAGINYAVIKGAKVINLSLGGYANSKALQDAVNNALAQNIVIVAGSGNDNSTIPFYPAAYSGVISVAATDSSDHKANFSNYGSWVKVSAPGVDVLTTALGGNYVLSSGNSQASPFVAGLAGLLVSLHPDWTPAMVLGQITHTADPIDALNPGFQGKLGAGRINATKALQPSYPILSYSGYSANGTASGRPDFNADVTLSVSLANDWADAFGVSATLSTTDPSVTVTTSTTSFGDILSDQTKENITPFAIHIATAAGYNHAIAFTLNVTANDGIYSQSFSFTVTTRSSIEETRGTIADDTLWSNDKIYKITGNVGVAPGVTLTIQPGTVVQFAGSYALNVGGTLIANGTALQPIVFQSFTNGQTWSRIFIDNPAQDGVSNEDGSYLSGTSLEHVTIQGAVSGLQCTTATPRLSTIIITSGGISCTLGGTPLNLPNSTITGDVSASGFSSSATLDYLLSGTTIQGNLSLPDKSMITNSTVSGSVALGAQSQVTLSTSGPISVGNQSQVTFNTTSGISTGTNSTVEDNIVNGSLTLTSGTAQRNQISAGNMSGGTGVVFTQNTITKGGIIAGNSSILTGNSVENSPDVGIQAGGNSTVTGNRIVGTTSHGISASTGTISGNLVANTTGDGLHAGVATILNNSFTGIKGNGVYLNGIPVNLEGNNFEFNTGAYDLYNDNPAGQYTLAPRNWWGTTITATIRDRIYEFSSDYSKGRVTFLPILTGPSQSAPAYARSLTLDPPSQVGIQTVNFTVEFSRPMEISSQPTLQFYTSERGNWKFYEMNSHPMYNGVWGLFVDSQGNRWFGNGPNAFGVTVFRPNGTWQTYNTSNSELPSNQVWDITEDMDKNVWFSTYGGVAVLKPDGIWKIYTTANSGLGSNSAMTIAVDSSNNKWIGSVGGEVSLLRDDGHMEGIYDGPL